ncbi:hypothetical protein MASR2M15_00860 [Anaerolineales bacterium]
MVHQVYISANENEAGKQFTKVARDTLWRIGDTPVAPVTADDLLEDQSDPLLIIERWLKKSDLFVGIYDNSYDEPPAGYTQSKAELAYHYAYNKGLSCLIFMPTDLPPAEDKRAEKFQDLLKHTHVIHRFSSLDELSSKLTLATVNFYQLIGQEKRIRTDSISDFQDPLVTFEDITKPALKADEVLDNELDDQDFSSSKSAESPKSAEKEEVWSPAPPRRSSPITSPPPPAPAPAPSIEPMPEPQAVIMPSESISSDHYDDKPMASAQEDSLETLITQALVYASDDIEQIVQRALEIHSAKQKMMQQQQSEAAGWLQANPVFGQPSIRDQFQMDAFMIMPFRDNFEMVYQNVVRPSMAALNLIIKRGDDFSSLSNVIINEVWSAIYNCKVVIVETTEINANVYYELGIAHTLGKPAILLSQGKEVEDFPFDIRHRRFIVYENTIDGAKSLEKQLKAQILSIMNDLDEEQA